MMFRSMLTSPKSWSVTNIVAMVYASMGMASDKLFGCSPLDTHSLQRHAARDHADMAERLWKVADEAACGRVDLFRQQSEWTRPATQRRVQIGSLIEFALSGQILDEPEAAQDEGSLVTRNSIGRFFVEVAVEKPVAGGESLRDR